LTSTYLSFETIREIIRFSLCSSCTDTFPRFLFIRAFLSMAFVNENAEQQALAALLEYGRQRTLWRAFMEAPSWGYERCYRAQAILVLLVVLLFAAVPASAAVAVACAVSVAACAAACDSAAVTLVLLLVPLLPCGYLCR
jgi:hypothetical protein